MYVKKQENLEEPKAKNKNKTQHSLIKNNRNSNYIYEALIGSKQLPGIC